MVNKILRIAGVNFLVGAFLLVAPLDGKAKSNGPQYGGTLRVILPFMINTWEPSDGALHAETTLMCIYEKLGIADWSGGPAGRNEYEYAHFCYTPHKLRVGNLAESWKVLDPQTVIFNLRKGVHFQDLPPVNGRELVADDVVFSFNRYINNPKSPKVFTLKWIESVKALDRYTVEFKFKIVNNELMGGAGIPWGFANLIFPHEVADTYGDFSDWKHAVGSGPFIVTDYVKGSSISFKKNPAYWRYDEVHTKNRLPYVDRLNLLVIPDVLTRIAAIRTGKADILMHVPPKLALSLLKTNPKLMRKKFVGMGTGLVNYKIWHKDKPNKPFSDIRVRKAISWAINRQELIDKYYDGQAVMYSWPMLESWKDVFVPFAQLPEEAQEVLKYDPEAARQILAQAGYPDGFKTTMLTSVAFDRDLAEIVISYLEKVGITCDLKQVQMAQWPSLVFAHTWDKMIIHGSGQAYPSTVLHYFMTGNIYNVPMDPDPVYQKKLAEIRTIPDMAQRTELIKETGIYLLKTYNNLPLVTPNQYSIWQPSVKGYHGECALGTMNYSGIWARIWVDR